MHKLFSEQFFYILFRQITKIPNSELVNTVWEAVFVIINVMGMCFF